MLKAISWLIKASAFALIVLVIANYFHVGEKTVSDQIKTHLAHAERSEVAGELKDWAHQITTDHKNGLAKKLDAEHKVQLISGTERTDVSVPRESAQPKINAVKTASEEIPSSERQKLRALMRELNTARSANQ